MTVKDSIGNELREGSLVYWKQLGAVCQIADIHMPEGSKQGEISMLVKVPFQASSPETYLRDFFEMVNPVETQKVSEMMKVVDNAKVS